MYKDLYNVEHCPFSDQPILSVHRLLAEEAERSLTDSKTSLVQRDSYLRQAENARQDLEDQVAVLQRAALADKDEIAKLRYSGCKVQAFVVMSCSIR